MKVNSTFFYSLFALNVLQATMSTNVFANTEKDDRWFEIEVILFQQLDDKNKLKEQFPEGITTSILPKYRESFDLLGHYIQPDLTKIKQFLPSCNTERNKEEQPFFLQSLKTTTTSLEKELQQIETITMYNQADFNKAQNALELDLQEDFSHPLFSNDTLCVISQQNLENLFDKEQLANININSIDVSALPSRLDASGTHDEDNPYLIADESLLLKDISQRLRWSKEFKPLLHFGWRQVGITKAKAIPLKLFAGEHLTDHYRKALTENQAEGKKAISLDENLFAQLTKVKNADKIANSTNQLKIHIKHNQQKLNQLFNSFETLQQTPLNKNVINDTVNQINKQRFETIILTDETQLTLNNQKLNNENRPKAPLQPWLLDGFIKVHLDHYLYITADLNIFNQDNVKTILDNEKSNEVKLINFSQNRRVITGEIHYFDHPYIGMIVQIRRFDPTKPEGEQITQSIK